ncbi:hypothetical protein KO465_00070 [Candidatus Micrarchaeota archaeon]|nr:hypothetical protein [Candidatus Micrarchaeota archaeon]
MKRHFIFDLMGVIFSEGHLIRHHLCDLTGISHDILKPNYLKFENKQITEKQFWENCGLPESTFEELFKKVINTFDDGILDIFEVYPDSSYSIVSNIPSSWGHKLIDWVENQTKIKFVRILSGDVGIQKPNLDIYILVLNSLNSQVTDEVYFFDDKPENLYPVEKLSIVPVHVFNPKSKHEKENCPYLRITCLRDFLEKN